MDNAFWNSLVSALGRVLLPRYNRNKKVNSNIQRTTFLLLATWGFWGFSIFGLGFLIYFIIRFNRIDGVCVGILSVCPAAGLLFYVWYRNTYVEITSTYILRRDFFRLIDKIEYRRIRTFGYHEVKTGGSNFEDGLYLEGPYNEKGYPGDGVQVHNLWANYGYVLGQLAFRILNDRWAGPESEEDQAQVKEYVSSGKARRVCLKYDGMVFPENDNKLGKEKE